MSNPDPDIIDLTKTPPAPSFRLVDHSSLANTVIEVLDDSFIILGNGTTPNSTPTQSSQTEITYITTSSTAKRSRTHLSNKKSILQINLENPENPENPQKPPTNNSASASSIRDRSPAGLGDCVICYEKIGKNPVASTQCGHIFCVTCLEQANKRDRRCPTCRKSLRGKNAFHRLYVADN